MAAKRECVLSIPLIVTSEVPVFPATGYCAWFHPMNADAAVPPD
jgi:hypothetical protein